MPVDHDNHALVALQSRLGYEFKQPGLLVRALSHRSAGIHHNERLEFLGDAVLNLGISTLLYHRHGSSDEGDLTRVRAHLVREASLHRMALQLGLGEVMLMSEAEARSGGKQRASMLADALEAVVAAVMLDAGFEAAQALVQRLFGSQIDHADAQQFGKDAKTSLQEWLQARGLPVPRYQLVNARGRAHEQVFEVSCEVPELQRASRGQGLSKRMAEQAAAQAMLATLGPKGAISS